MELARSFSGAFESPSVASGPRSVQGAHFCADEAKTRVRKFLDRDEHRLHLLLQAHSQPALLDGTTGPHNVSPRGASSTVSSLSGAFPAGSLLRTGEVLCRGSTGLDTLDLADGPRSYTAGGEAVCGNAEGEGCVLRRWSPPACSAARAGVCASGPVPQSAGDRGDVHGVDGAGGAAYESASRFHVGGVVAAGSETLDGAEVADAGGKAGCCMSSRDVWGRAQNLSNSLNSVNSRINQSPQSRRDALTTACARVDAVASAAGLPAAALPPARAMSHTDGGALSFATVVALAARASGSSVYVLFFFQVW